LWRNNFEGSQFCEPPETQCDAAKLDPRRFIWLELDPPAGWEDTPPGGLYAVDFIGRRSLFRGFFGHFGMSRNEVIVDRLISIRQVEAPPKEPTKAEMIADSKKCEAEKSCVPNWSYINGYDEAKEKKAHIEGYLKDCAGKPICMPNSEVPTRK